MRAYNSISKQPFTPLQLTREAAFTKANQAWTTIGIEAATQWRDWGRTQKVRNELTGKYRSRAGKDCFCGAYAKILQIDPSAAVPEPPSEPMAIQTLSISVSIGSNSANWSSLGGNTEGVTTEFLVQRLPSAVALPTREYATQGFHEFTSPSGSVTLPMSPGYWSFAYRFVETSTGRIMGFTALGTQKVTMALVQGGTDAAPAKAAKKAA